MKCDRCEKEMTAENDSSIIGFSITVRCENESSLEFYQKQMGKYKLDKDYNFCFECLIDSLMGVNK